VGLAAVGALGVTATGAVVGGFASVFLVSVLLQAVAVRPTTIDSIAVRPIERTDLDREVSFMMVEISRRILVLDQSTKRDADRMSIGQEKRLIWER
jgi:hypothetical protein